MLLSARPASFPIPFAANAGGSFIRSIPVNSQIGVLDGAASLNDGFVPDNFIPLAGGGVPPFGQDMNGILKQVTAWCQWLEAGGPVSYDSAFSTAIGGYPKGARLISNVAPAFQWYSAIDGNATNPDDPLTSSGWIRVGIPAGMPLPFLTSAVPGTFAIMNGSTIGNASSNATYADPATLFLYVFNWPNTILPILTSGGVVTTRGANAVADFNANKQLTMPNAKGLGLIGADTMGGSASSFLSGVPIQFGNATAPGSVLGENLHTLITAEIPAVGFSATSGTESASHTHPYNQTTNNQPVGGGYSGTGNISGVQSGATTGPESVTHTHFVSGNISGGNGSHNNVERSMIVYWGQSL